MTDRFQTRATLVALSEKRNTLPLCWKCKTNRGSEVHELVNRNQTSGEAREISYEPELCVLLCRECHEQAPTVASETWLWVCAYIHHGRGDIDKGKKRVVAALTRLNDAQSSPAMVHLPEDV